MSNEEVLKIQTCVLKVNIHCDGCQKKVKKILHKIEGVYQTRMDAEKGMVMVSGQVDPATIIKKLSKVGKRAELWGSKVGVAAVNNQIEKFHLTGGGKGGQPKDTTSDKGQPKDASGKGQKGGGGRNKEAKMMMPPHPTPQQIQQLQQHLQMNGLKLPQFMDGKMPPFSATAAAATSIKDPMSVKFNIPEDGFVDDGSEFDDEFADFDDEEDFNDGGLDDEDYNDPMMMKQMAMLPPNASGGGDKKGGKKGGRNEIPVQIKGNSTGGGGSKKDVGGNQNQGGSKNGGGGQPNNDNEGGSGAVNGGGNHPGAHGKKGGGSLVGGPMGRMPTQQQAMTRPNLMGPRGAGFTGMGQMGSGSMTVPQMAHHHHPQMGNGAVQGMLPPAFYQGGGMLEMPQATAVAGNPMAQHQHMAMMQQQQHLQQQQMMMNGNHGYYGHGHGGGAPTGYPAAGYGYGRPVMQYPMSYPMQLPPLGEPYNYFSDENPNGCSVM
uniref:HMA domain-containing protein n=1 Tax=Leersia perrieri TaxID=77586 RepID=A0A0D9XSE0_9ORYZ